MNILHKSQNLSILHSVYSIKKLGRLMHKHIITAGLLGLIISCSEAPSSSPSTIKESTDMPNYSHPYTRIKQLDMNAPVALREDTVISHHGYTVSDPYQWLKDQGYPEVNDQPVLDYLNEENEYYGAFKAQHQSLIDTLFEEFKGRVDDEFVSVPVANRGFEYWYEYQAGSDYRTYIRRNIKDGGEQVILDLPELAKGTDYFVLGSYDISPDNNLIAYTVDTSGDERYELFVKNLNTGEILETVLTDVRGDVSFTADSKSIIYDKLSMERWATESVNVHRIGTKQTADIVLYTETNDEFGLGHYTTSDEKYLVLYTGTRDVSEIYAVPLENVRQPLVQIVSREQGFSAMVDHAFDTFYILANDTHSNYRIATLASNNPVNNEWQTLMQGDASLYIKSLSIFRYGLVVKLARNGLDALHVVPFAPTEKPYDIEFPEHVFSARLGNNPDFNANVIRISYESMITPDTLFAYDFADRQKTILKKQNIPSGYDASQYHTERLMAPSRDGVMIPVSIVYRKDFAKDRSHPVHLYAYGAYGYGLPTSFSSLRLSLLDRGFAFAIAHTRGGDEMGYQWYLDGKMTRRQNAFNDFVDVAQFLIDEQYAAAGNISISGGSAGGKMMGAVTFMEPNLWRSVLLDVPFVDVLNTMLDETLPLTPPEWSEWGNPITDKEAFERILSYSPYDNILAREYPPMMVTGGLNDPRVTYWEPAKWTARMRAEKTDDNLLIMRMNMSAGHYANSGRYGRLLDAAEEYAFILVSHQINE